MIGRIPEFSLRQRAVLLLLSAALLAAGLWSAWHLPIDAVPDITGVQVQVNTEVPALATEESEKLVTRVLELELAGLPGLEEMRSVTKFGLSQVTLDFRDGTDIYRARQLVAERLQGALGRLPRGVRPRLAPMSTGLGEILYSCVNYRPDAKGAPASELERLIELSRLQEYTIKPALRAVPGIADINGSGGYELQYVVQPRPEALVERNLTFSGLAALVAQNVGNAGGGIIDRGGQQLTIRAVGRVRTVEDLANLPVKLAAGTAPLLVRDVADVRIGTKFRNGAATLDGQEAVIGTTMMLAGENSRDVAARVKARIAELKRINPEYRILFAQPIEMRFNEMLEGTKAELAVKVFGDDYDVLEPLAGRIKGILEKVPGVAQVEYETEGLLPLGEVVEFTTLQTVEPIQRDGGRRRAALMVNLRTRDIEGYVEAAGQAIRDQVKLPAGYSVEFGGQFENLQEARARLAVIVPAALALIFGLIFLAFGSVRQALLIFSGVPLAVTGGVAALWLRGLPFSITAAVGFIALTGVAVLNGVVLVSHFNQLREDGKSVLDAVLEGSLTRQRPVLMTAAVASLGFLPMALATGAGAEVQRPLATVVIGGILSSTLLTLVVLPVLCAWWEGTQRARN